MEDHLVIVTGGSSGLGRALLATASPGARRIDISRSGADPDGVHHLAADLADPSSWQRVAEAIAGEVAVGDWDRITVVHSAGTLDPIGFAAEVDPDAYTNSVLLGSAAGQVLGARVLAALRDLDNRRELVLISSGAARTPYLGWSAYSAGKAALDQWVRVVGAEQAERGGVRVLAVAPGVLETGIQELIRSTDAREFPRVERFRQLHADGALVSPEDAARRLWALLDGDVPTGSVVDLRHHG